MVQYGGVIICGKKFTIWFFLWLSVLLPANAQIIKKVAPHEEIVLKKVIFLPFYNQDSNVDYAWIETSITLWLDDAASKKYRYIKIPESAWREYMEKNTFTNADLYDEARLSQLGKALGADGIVYGRFVYDKETNKMIMDGKILSVIDKTILADKRVEAPLDFKIFDATEDLGVYLSERIKDLFLPTDEGALWRSALAPGWGFFYKQQETWGYIHASATGTAFVIALFGSINFYIKKNAYLEYKPEHVITPSGETALYDPDAASAKFNELEKNATKAGKLARGAMYAFLILYTANLVHSYFIEPDAGNIQISYLDATPQEGDIRFALTPVFWPETDSGMAGAGVTSPGGLDGVNFSLSFYY